MRAVSGASLNSGQCDHLVPCRNGSVGCLRTLDNAAHKRVGNGELLWNARATSSSRGVAVESACLLLLQSC